VEVPKESADGNDAVDGAGHDALALALFLAFGALFGIDEVDVVTFRDGVARADRLACRAVDAFLSNRQSHVHYLLDESGEPFLVVAVPPGNST
jgi:hypothetical protein